MGACCQEGLGSDQPPKLSHSTITKRFLSHTAHLSWVGGLGRIGEYNQGKGGSVGNSPYQLYLQTTLFAQNK